MDTVSPHSESGLESSLVRLQQLESELDTVRNNVRDARITLDEARIPLQKAEKELKTSWTRRKARQGSLYATQRAARACGLERSPSTALSVGRIQTQIDAATEEIHRIIDSSADICKNFDAAWALYSSSRLEEKRVVELISVIGIERAQEEPLMRRRREQARTELSELERTDKADEIQKRKDFSVDSDGHFDPNYDEREILIRKMRPWL